jgi:hypothetical protein
LRERRSRLASDKQLALRAHVLAGRSACCDATHAAEPTAIGESLLVVLTMRDELLADLIGWLDRVNVDV